MAVVRRGRPPAHFWFLFVRAKRNSPQGEALPPKAGAALSTVSFGKTKEIGAGNRLPRATAFGGARKQGLTPLFFTFSRLCEGAAAARQKLPLAYFKKYVILYDKLVCAVCSANPTDCIFLGGHTFVRRPVVIHSHPGHTYRDQRIFRRIRNSRRKRGTKRPRSCWP